MFKRDRANKPALTDAQLRARGNVTYTCVPKGNGRRLGIDRDLAGTLDKRRVARRHGRTPTAQRR